MKKQILNIGKALSRAEQKAINGGRSQEQDMCSAHCNCSEGQVCEERPCAGEKVLMCVAA